jgi:hypothetical protein
MQKNERWNFVEKIIKVFPEFIPYPVISFFFIGIIYSIFIFLDIKVGYFDISKNIKLTILLALIWFQLSIIPYLLNNMRDSVRKTRDYYLDYDANDGFYTELKERFVKSKKYYIIVILTISPFLANDLIKLYFTNEVLFSVLEPQNMWSYILDIYSYGTGYLMLYLLSIILLIIVNTYWSLDRIEKGSIKHLPNIDLFNIERAGELMPFTNFVLLLIVSYFICTGLLMSYYITQPIALSLELLFIVILSSIGACLLFAELRTIGTIRRIIDTKIGRVLISLNWYPECH